MAYSLAGFKVLELASFISGPFCGMLLADLGADVIKVEAPGQGDLSRPLAPLLGGDGAGFQILNRNKRSLAVDLKSDEGRSIFLRLVAESDVILEGFRPGTVAELGIDEEVVWKVNPRIVYCHNSGFGQTGPYRERAGLDLIAQGTSGLMSITGEPGRPPVKCGAPIADYVTALFASSAILSALLERERSGKGQSIDVNLNESAIALSAWELGLYFATGEVAGPLGSAHRAMAPYRAFKAADGYMTIGVSNQRHWARLCQILEIEHLRDDRRFATNSDRMGNEHELAALIEEVTVTRPRAHWLRLLDEVGIPAGPVLTYDQVLVDPHVQARGVVAEADHPRAGKVKYTRTPIRFSRTPLAERRAAPVLGEHTADILAELGYDPSEVARLAERRVIALPKT